MLNRRLRLWLRPHCSPAVGLGHLMRSLAVAQAARSRGLAVAYFPDAAGDLARLPGRYGFEVSEAWELARGDAVLFDGYAFGPSDYEGAGRAGARVAAMDDFGTGRFDVDVLVNPNIVADPRYVTRPDTRVLIGPRFALVRQEFLPYRRMRGESTDTLLVVLGGSDATNLTATLLDALRPDRRFRRTVLVQGPAAPEVRVDDSWVSVVRDPPEVAAVFDSADAAIVAAGTTTWELLAMGIPTALIQVADNQRHVMEAAGTGAALSLETPADLSERLPAVMARLADVEVQRELSDAALKLVDGNGAGRVVAALVD